MIYQYKQNELINARRRVYMVLVLSSDGQTEATGITGTPTLDKNGGTAVSTTNSLVEVDSSNSPGRYYVELTSDELSDLGFLGVRFKAATTAAFHVVCQVTSDDPYINHSGPGMTGGGGRAVSGLKKEEMVELAKMMWNVLLRGKNTAKDVLLELVDRAEFDPAGLPAPASLDLAPVLKQLESLEQLYDLVDGQRETLAAVKGLKIPDATKQLDKLLVQVAGIASESKLHTATLQGFDSRQLGETLTVSATQIQTALTSLEQAVETVSETGEQMQQVQQLLADVTDDVAEAMNLNNQFKEMSDKMTNKQLTDLKTSMETMTKRLLISIETTKYQLQTRLTK